MTHKLSDTIFSDGGTTILGSHIFQNPFYFDSFQHQAVINYKFRLNEFDFYQKNRILISMNCKYN